VLASSLMAVRGPRRQSTTVSCPLHSGGGGGDGETARQSQAAHEPWGLRREAQDGVGGAARRGSGWGGRMAGRVGQGYACEQCRAVPADLQWYNMCHSVVNLSDRLPDVSVCAPAWNAHR